MSVFEDYVLCICDPGTQILVQPLLIAVSFYWIGGGGWIGDGKSEFLHSVVQPALYLST